MSSQWVRHISFGVVAIAVVLFCTATDAEPEKLVKPIVIGSKNFTENRILAEIMAQLIEAQTSIPVDRKINLGGTKVVFSALQSGQIDLYPEYTGTGWSIHLKKKERVVDSLRAYLTVKQEFADRYQVVWLMPFGFSNSYALAMPKERAEELHITQVSDLKAHQDTLIAGVSHEFLSRHDGYPGLAEAYGLKLKNLSGMEHGLAYEALRTRKIDVIDTWTTDGKLLKYNVRVLEDDQRFFPPYDAAPIVRQQTVDQYPEIVSLLEKLAFRLSNRKMQELNYQVEEAGGSYEKIARAFLEREGLIQTALPQKQRTKDDQPGLWGFMRSRAGPTLALTLEHLFLTGIAMALAIFFAVPLGIVLTRRTTPIAQFVIGATGVVQTVPSLALLAFMIPIPGLGLGARSAIAALFVYALLPIVRNTYTGIRETDPDLIEAAQGMGLRDRQILFRVELPLATRTIMAGIRTSTVISIGVATLAAFIGAGGLGDPIVTGLQLNDTRLILSGAIPAAILAIVVDFILGRIEGVLAPAS